MTSRPPTLTSKMRGTYTAEHGTPDWVLDIHRELFGPTIDLDLASSKQFNKTVKAKQFYSKANPCPKDPPVQRDDIVWCNPPGPSGNVVAFWDIFCRCINDHDAQGSFLVFSVDHVRFLKKLIIRVPSSICFLRNRVKYIGNESSAAIGSALVCTMPLYALPETVRPFGKWLTII